MITGFPRKFPDDGSSKRLVNHDSLLITLDFEYLSFLFYFAVRKNKIYMDRKCEGFFALSVPLFSVYSIIFSITSTIRKKSFKSIFFLSYDTIRFLNVIQRPLEKS